MIAHDDYTQFATVRESGPRGEHVYVFGDVDLSTADQLSAAVDEASAGGAALLLDFARCRYLDSSGLAVLNGVRRRLGNRLTILTEPGTQVYRILHVVGFDKILRLVTEPEPRLRVVPPSAATG